MPVEIEESLRASNVVLVRASGRLTDEDYQQFVSKFEKLIQDRAKLCLLFEMVDFRGWDLHGAWDDLKFGLRHSKDLRCIAMIGQKRWQRWMSRLCGWFTTVPVRYFDHKHMRNARIWVQSFASSDGQQHAA